MQSTAVASAAWRAASRWFTVVAVLLLAALPVSAADALKGVALVIGNGKYEHLAKLANPENDAKAIEDLLSGLGFQTDVSSDRDARRLQRDLEGFAEDAEDADVAVLYYSGHGIEAGGENFLVPVDADLSALENASKSLVPVSGLIAELKAKVPIVIVMLDACRDSPFPAGSTITLQPGGKALEVSSAGLGATRGASPLAGGGQPLMAANDNSLGAVIAFAAEPGKTALDGDPGQNSPYAAALLRHLSAMTGEEFGTVMRMVAEEVYLKTNGAQRPWINESMRRLLYFGEAAADPTGADGEVLRERRQLLVTIAALPTARRTQAETLAREGQVPMSVVYALMKAAGMNPDTDPAQQEAKLRAEIERFAKARAERDTLMNPDPEIQRLTKLADDAELEGAFAAASDFRDQAKARVVALRPARQEQAAALRQRILEDAEVYKKSAETKQLLFDYRGVAADYGEAYAIVADWDQDKAYDFRRFQLEAIKTIAAELGDPAALDEGFEIATAELNATRPNWTQAQRGRFAKFVGQTQLIRGRQQDDIEAIKSGSDTLRHALELTGDSDVRETAVIWNDIAVASVTRAERTDSANDYADAADALRKSLDYLDPGAAVEKALLAIKSAPDEHARNEAVKNFTHIIGDRNATQLLTDFSMAKHNLGVALRGLGRLRKDKTLRDEALDSYDLALKVRISIDAKADAASTYMNIGNIKIEQAGEGVEGALDEAVENYQASIDNLDPKANPISYADVVEKLTDALLDNGQSNAAQAAQRALDIIEKSGLELADTSTTQRLRAEIESNRGRAYAHMAVDADSAQAIEKWSSAIEAYRRAAPIFPAKGSDYAYNMRNLGHALYNRGSASDNAEDYRAAAEAYTAAALGFGAESDKYAATLYDEGRALHNTAAATDSADDYAAALKVYLSALAAWKQGVNDEDRSFLEKNIGLVRFALAGKSGKSEDYRAAAASFEASAKGFTRGGNASEALNNAYERARSLHEAAAIDDKLDAFSTTIQAYEAVVKLAGGAPENKLTLSDSFNNIGTLYRAMSAHGDTTANLAKAIDSIQKALAILDRLATDPKRSKEVDRSTALGNLAVTRYLLATETKSKADYQAAAQAYDAQLAAIDRQADEHEWGVIANDYAFTLMLSARGGDRATYEKAVDLARNSVNILEKSGNSYLGYARGTLCRAMIDLGRIDKDRTMISDGLQECEASATLLNARPAPDADAIAVAKADLKRGRDLLAELK